MKLPFKLTAGVALAAGLATGSLRATTFDFSYVFGTSPNPPVVTGTLEGDLNGNLIENISNITLLFDGIAAPGTVLAFQSDLVSAPVISLDAANNDFYFLQFTSFDPTNVDLSVYDSLFAMTGADAGSALVVYAQGVFQDSPVTPTWTLTAETTVPDTGGTLLLVGTSLGFLGWLHRRARPGALVR